VDECVEFHVPLDTLQVTTGTSLSRQSLAQELTKQVSGWLRRFSCSARHITGHYGHESFPAITCTGTDKTCEWMSA